MKWEVNWTPTKPRIRVVDITDGGVSEVSKYNLSLERGNKWLR